MVDEIKPTNWPLVAVVGPTASGKSALALQLALKHNGEIICGDSQTIRKHMDIGTAKPSRQECSLVRHHLLDIIEPYDTFSAADFKQAAIDAINEINSRKKLPILVGGSGLYIDSVLFDYQFAPVPSIKMRKKLEILSVIQLQNEILRKGYNMPTNEQNPRHLIRTIEGGGQKATKKEMRSNTLIIGLMPNKEELKSRIDKRVEVMFEAGFVKEVQSLVTQFGLPPRSFDAIGYKIVLNNTHDNKVDIKKAKQDFKTADYQYSKRQVTWFKRNPRIHWISDMVKGDALVTTFLNKNSKQ